MPEVESKDIRNVGESWPLVDSIVICSLLTGRESQIRGWFRTFQQFFAQAQHSLFKDRTAGNCGAAYNNQQIADSMDYGFVAYSLGVSFFAPCIMQSADPNVAEPVEVPPYDLVEYENALASWWTHDLPRHCGIQFKVNQDIVLEASTMMTPPGYGPISGGMAFEIDPTLKMVAPLIPDPPQNAINIDFGPRNKEFSLMVGNINQGPSCLEARWPFAVPLEIPKMATIEGILNISDFALVTGRALHADTPRNYFWKNPLSAQLDEKRFVFFPQRFGIQMSLYGVRYIQQRGQYHR
jgi:hypothetical protein